MSVLYAYPKLPSFPGDVVHKSSLPALIFREAPCQEAVTQQLVRRLPFCSGPAPAKQGMSISGRPTFRGVEKDCADLAAEWCRPGRKLGL